MEAINYFGSPWPSRNLVEVWKVQNKPNWGCYPKLSDKQTMACYDMGSIKKESNSADIVSGSDMTSSPRDNDREQHWETAMPWVGRPLLWWTRQSWDEGFGEETIAMVDQTRLG